MTQKGQERTESKLALRERRMKARELTKSKLDTKGR